MLDNQTYSFTQRVLFNQTVLNLIDSSNCEENKIVQTGNSILSTEPDDCLINALFEGKMKTSFLHFAAKPLRALVRVAFIGVVNLTVAPVGVLWNGALATAYYVKYRFDSVPQARTWEKVSQYGNGCFKDFKCFGVGVLVPAAIALGGLTAYTCVNLLAYGSATGFLAPILAEKAIADLAVILAGSIGFSSILSVFCTGVYDPSDYFSDVLSNSSDSIGMYVALELRRELGIVREDGSLLHFSKDDEGKELKEFLRYTLYDLEEDLILYVKDANDRLGDMGRELIPFAYPFNGNEIAKSLKEHLPTISKDSNVKYLQKVIDDLETRAKQIDVMRNLYHRSGLAIAKRENEGIKVPFTLPNSFITYDDYKEIFEAIDDYGVDILDLFDDLDVTCYNPDDLNDVEPNDPNDLYGKFLYKLRVGKHLAENDQWIDLHTFFDLESDFTFEDLEQALDRYDLALDPEKNDFENLDEANIIWDAYRDLAIEIQYALESQDNSSLTFFSKFYETYSFANVDPQKERPIAGLAAQFMYDLEKNKSNILQGVYPCEPYELFGLSDGFDENDAKAVFRKYQLAFHSDKNKSQDADLLFKAFNELKKRVMRDFKRDNSVI